MKEALVRIETHDIDGRIQMVVEQGIAQAQQGIDRIRGGMRLAPMKPQIGLQERPEQPKIRCRRRAFIAHNLLARGGHGNARYKTLHASQTLPIRSLEAPLPTAERTHVANLPGDDLSRHTETEALIARTTILRLPQGSVFRPLRLQTAAIRPTTGEIGDINTLVEQKRHYRRGQGGIAEDDDLVYLHRWQFLQHRLSFADHQALPGSGNDCALFGDVQRPHNSSCAGVYSVSA